VSLAQVDVLQGVVRGGFGEVQQVEEKAHFSNLTSRQAGAVRQ
jgi:hypothetical protein